MIDIGQLNEAALIDLNHRDVAHLKFLQQMRAHSHMLDFSIGQKVCFQPEGRLLLHGSIAKYKRKTVIVITDNGQQWRVAPVFLRRDVGSAAPEQMGQQATALAQRTA